MLNLESTVVELAISLEKSFARQNIDPQSEDYGAFIQPELGLADASHVGTAALIHGAAILFLSNVMHADESIHRASMAADFVLRAQRSSGLIDMLSCNYDSTPDTAFVVQIFCALIELGRIRAVDDREWNEFAGKLESFVRRATPGLAIGGFHTPNHRWVIASALAQIETLFPDLKVGAAIESYLTEGPDIDGDGAFIERSPGIYDAVTDRSLLLLAEHRGWQKGKEAATRNLDFNLHLLHADGTIETGISRRQDFSASIVPLSLAACYLQSAGVDHNPTYLQAAEFFWQKRKTPSVLELSWLCTALVKYGDPAMTTDAALAQTFSRFFPQIGLWRVRDGLLSSSFFRDSTRLMNLRFGEAELARLSISQSYFGVGKFVGTDLRVDGQSAVFRSAGKSDLRPGYQLPIGRPVSPDEWDETMRARPRRDLPPCQSALQVSRANGGFDFRYVTENNFPGVMAQVAFDFPPGGIWETEDNSCQPHAGEEIFLKRGFGSMRYGADVIRIGPGAAAHRMTNMRDTELAPNHVRVIFALRTPIDHAFEIRTKHGI